MENSPTQTPNAEPTLNTVETFDTPELATITETPIDEAPFKTFEEIAREKVFETNGIAPDQLPAPVIPSVETSRFKLPSTETLVVGGILATSAIAGGIIAGNLIPASIDNIVDNKTDLGTEAQQLSDEGQQDAIDQLVNASLDSQIPAENNVTQLGSGDLTNNEIITYDSNDTSNEAVPTVVSIPVPIQETTFTSVDTEASQLPTPEQQ